MNVKQLISKLNKCNPKARVIVATDHDGNQHLTIQSIRTIKDKCDGYDELEDWQKEETWNTGDVELDIWG